MFIKATLAQTRFILKQKEALIVFYILLIQVFANFISNVLTFQDMDIIKMYHPMKILLLSYNRVNYNADATLLFIQLYPLLVVFPAGFALCKEQQSGQEVFMIARLGQLTYKFSKLVASFIVTTTIFTIPFLIEVILNCLSFPLNAVGDFTFLNIYDLEYIPTVNKYLMSDIYVHSPYLYAIIGILLFGICSGVLASFSVAISSIIRVKYRIVLFLPVFILLYATIYVQDILPKSSKTIKWFDYILLFNDESKSILYFIIGLFALILFSLIATFYSCRRENIK